MIQPAPLQTRPARHPAAVPNRGTITRLEPRAQRALPCECGSPRCRLTVPAGAAAHRAQAGYLLVVPEHRGDRTTVRAADRFFVVERA
jgi:hypothetical protein